MTKPRTRKPRMGPEWEQLWTVTGKLAEHQSLDPRERDWLCGLLNAIGTDIDVRDMFFQTVSHRPAYDDLHFWMAVDVERLKHDGAADPYAAAGDRWNMTAESVKKTLTRKSVKFGEVPLMHPDVIEYHRRRLHR